ncbi:glycine cleavage system protein GcvH [Natranaerobius thermophilus]|uniref:Glycine cleavage system H protein n=1 Tax=Natranaerobius thermophilus (strain ATCC BAA-1301 / DSM 18059 / JW/NM-WN-LF) TaxID=457570 RepID=B2A2T3_NATTJ|nr:glycine cleavage system protein GcvH [Natranaerobius thermophilus]ACB86301.1 glycine cleavage system H protein [Natranaerobius thermophilus JW/NM-WN-LF]
MVNVPEEFYYSKDHEWIKKLEDGKVCVGVTDYAQDQLGDIVFVELPEEEDEYEQEETFTVIESVKAVADTYAPVSGTIDEINEDLEDSPELINQDPYGDGWIAVFQLSDESELEELLSAEEYQNYLQEIEEEE